MNLISDGFDIEWHHASERMPTKEDVICLNETEYSWAGHVLMKWAGFTWLGVATNSPIVQKRGDTIVCVYGIGFYPPAEQIEWAPVPPEIAKYIDSSYSEKK